MAAISYVTFSELYREAFECEALDMYIAELGWQDWMDKYDDVEDVVKDLAKIYEMAHRSVRDVREEYGFSRAAFARAYHVPLRTVEDWEYKNTIPSYVKSLICYALFIGDCVQEGASRE